MNKEGLLNETLFGQKHPNKSWGVCLNEINGIENI